MNPHPDLLPKGEGYIDVQKTPEHRSPIRIKAVFGLAYVLLSSYLIAGFGTNRWLMGTWDLNLQFGTHALAASSLQLLVLTLFLRLSPVQNSHPEYVSDQGMPDEPLGVKRFLLTWLCLFIPFVLATALTSVFLFKHIDLRYIRYFQLMAIPLLQSLVLFWVLTPGPARFPAHAIRQIFDHRAIAALLLLEIGLVLAGIAFPLHDYLGILASHSILLAWSALQLAIAGIIALALYRHESYRLADKLWIVVFSCMSLAIAVDTIFPWINNIPLIAQNSMLVFVQVKFTKIFIFIAALIVLLKIGHILQLRCKSAGLLLGAAVMILFLIANIFFLDLYQPYPTPFAQTVIRSGISIACTCTLAGILLHLLTVKFSGTATMQIRS